MRRSGADGRLDGVDVDLCFARRGEGAIADPVCIRRAINQGKDRQQPVADEFQDLAAVLDNRRHLAVEITVEQIDQHLRRQPVRHSREAAHVRKPDHRMNHFGVAERIGQLAEKAAVTLAKLGYDNVHVLHADGTQGWPEHAPYDAIVVAAGGPKIPESLQQQLKVGGRLVIPVGTEVRAQELVRVTRVSETEFQREDLADVRFVPLLGKEGWEPEAEPSLRRKFQVVPPSEQSLSRIIARAAEPFGSIETADLKPLLSRIGDARVVLIGEASHGTSEFSPAERSLG
jgi:rhodanese-related sulfurtransferase